MRPSGAVRQIVFAVSEDRGCVVVAFAHCQLRDETPANGAYLRISVEPKVQIYHHSFN